MHKFRHLLINFWKDLRVHWRVKSPTDIKKPITSWSPVASESDKIEARANRASAQPTPTVKPSWWFGIWQQCQTFDNISISRSLSKTGDTVTGRYEEHMLFGFPFFRMDVSWPVQKTSGTKPNTIMIWYNNVNIPYKKRVPFTSWSAHKPTIPRDFVLFGPIGICSYIWNRYDTVRKTRVW